MKILLLASFITVSSCAATPIDPSIPIENNHMRIEMDINGKTSLGMASINVDDNTSLKETILSFSPIGEGSLELFSDRCQKSFSIGHSKNDKIKIPLENLLPNATPTKCTYRVLNRINKVKNLMVGYFGINYSQETRPLLIEINNEKFIGTSWLQLRETLQNRMIPITEPTTLKILPTSNSGKLTIKGCGISFAPIEFNSTPIIINLKDIFPNGLSVNDSCDYEITTSNFENPFIESHMFMLNVYKYNTSWLEAPVIKYYKFWRILKVKFFNPYISIIKIKNTSCYRKTCYARCRKNEECTIRGMTTSGRFFYGKVKNGKLLEVK